MILKNFWKINKDRWFKFD